MYRSRVAIVACAAALGVAGCGGDDGPGREGFVEDLTESGLNQETADCVADKTEAEFGSDVFDKSEPPEGLQDKAFDFGRDCATENAGG